MSLQIKTVTVKGVKFEVREITIGEVMPILPRLSDTEQAQDAQMEIMQLCIKKDGKSMGEKVADLGISTYLDLAEEVMAINGLSTVGKDSAPTE